MADGLREHKKRETRQRISDIATQMFLERGFETVTIAEIAAAAEVSEKTVYNYFPAKETLVFDQIDAEIERLVGAVRDRQRGTTVTAGFLAALQDHNEDFAEMIRTRGYSMLQQFGAMISETPALQAAWGEYRHRLVAELAAVVAAELTIDPIEPEPLTAARALSSLMELQYDAMLRYASEDVPVGQYLELVNADVARGARLLDTGMWSLHLMVEGRRTKDQVLEAATRAEQARQQVLSTLRRAKREWGANRQHQTLSAEARKAGHEAHRQAHQVAREAHQQAHAAARDAARQARQQAQAAVREAGDQARAQAQAAIREAKEQAREQTLAAVREAREQTAASVREARDQALASVREGGRGRRK